MHRAVAIECRAMTNTLACAMRLQLIPWMSLQKGDRNMWLFKKLLKQIWKGTVTWTARAQREARFWAKVNFLTLEAPMSHDAVAPQVEQAIRVPRQGFLHADTSKGIHARHVRQWVGSSGIHPKEWFVFTHGRIVCVTYPDTNKAEQHVSRAVRLSLIVVGAGWA